MNTRAPNLIHGLTFDISIAGMATDSIELTEWIKAALLPVMEEVFDQHDRQGELRRIEQLEIDLGTVSQEDSRVELARRLFARLSEALGWSLQSATATGLVEQREQQLGDQLLDFLRTGRLAWSAATDTRSAHRQLLHRVLESNQAEQVLRTAIGDPQMLSRLVLQFEPDSLRSVAEVLSRSWTEQERAALYGTEEGGIALTETYWRSLLLASARPPFPQNQGEGLQQLRRIWSDLSLTQRDALRLVWSSLADDLRQRLGNRPITSLNPDAKSDLALLLRRRALALVASLGEEWPPAQVETVVQVLLAADDSFASLLMSANPARATAEVEMAGSTAQDDQAQQHQKNMSLLAHVLTTCDLAQRNGFLNIWQRLSVEIVSRTGGRAVETLSAVQKTELARLLLPRAVVMLKESGWQWPELLSPQDQQAFVLSVVQLLFAGDTASAAVLSMLANTNDLAQRSVIAPTPQHRVAALPTRSANGAAEANIAGGTVAKHDQQATLALLESLWKAFVPAQRGAFRDILRQLAGELASRSAGRALATLTAVQRADLALTLQPAAEVLLREFRHQWPESIALQDEMDVLRAATQLLLAGNDASVAVESILAGPSDPHPGALAATQHNALSTTSAPLAAALPTSSANGAAAANIAGGTVAKQHQQASLALLGRMWKAFVPAQRIAFRDIWRQLAGELASRSAGRALETLTALQRADLALTLQPVAEVLLREFRHQWPESIAPQNEMDVLRAATQLLLAGSDTSVAVESMLASPGHSHPGALTATTHDALLTTSAPQDAARHGATAENIAAGTVAKHDQQASLALLESLWKAFVPAQRSAFRSIWRQLADELASLSSGRALATLTAVQRADLALTLQSVADVLLGEFRHQWPESIAPQDETDVLRAATQLLLAGNDASVAVESMLTGPSDAHPEALTATTHDELSTMSEPRTAALATVSNVEHAPESESPADAGSAGGGMPQSQAVWRSAEMDLALLLRAWSEFDAAQRDTFRKTWRHLGTAMLGRTGGRAVKTLSSAQRNDLVLTLTQAAEAMLKELRDHRPGSISPQVGNDAALWLVQLLLSGDIARDAVEAMLAGKSDLSKAALAARDVTLENHTSQQSPQLLLPLATLKKAERLPTAQPVAEAQLKLTDVDAAVAVKSIVAESPGRPLAASATAQRDAVSIVHDQRAAMAQLARVLQKLERAQREAIEDIWARLSSEATSRTLGRPMKMLSTVQKTDLALTLRPVAGAMMVRVRHQWPALIAPQEERQIIQSMLHLLLAEEATASAASIVAGGNEKAPTAVPPLAELVELAVPVAAAQPPREAATINPLLAAFRDWQQAKLDILLQPMALAELWQWLNWWMLHDPQHAGQDRGLMLSAIEAQAQDVADPVLFMKLVLCVLRSGDALDLEALALRAGHSDDGTPTEPVKSIELRANALRESLQSRTSLQKFIAQQDAPLLSLNSVQLHQLIRGWLHLQQPGSAAPLFLTAIEAHALQAASMHAFLSRVLRLLIADRPVDLEQLLADAASDDQALAAEDGSGDEYIPEPAPVADPPALQLASALPAQLRQALPQRLASAMLQADLASLEILWPEIVRSHGAELAEAARRYLGRSELRARLIAHADISMLKDLLGVLSRSSMLLAEPLLQHSLQCGATLTSPLAATEFEQRVLRFAFEQALKPDIGAIEWLNALMSGIQEMNQEQHRELQYAWYEVLRSAKRSTPLLNALGKGLFPQTEYGRSAPEPIASLLLMREAEPDEDERIALTSLLHRIAAVTATPQRPLASALAEPQAVLRLVDILPGAELARLFATLQPGLAAQLPALLRQLHKTLPIALAPVPAMLDRRVWRAIYLAAFADHAGAAPAAFARAVVIRLASQHRQADPALWLEKTIGAAWTATEAAGTPSAITADQAMAQMLQPWAEPKPEAPVKKPEAATRGEDEPLPLTGESNIHNAGLVIVVPYVQRLFGLLELTVDGKFVSDEAAQRGVHLLQYVVTGEESTPEYLLVLNKLLCGIHGGEPIVPGIGITDKEKTIIEQMLNGVITHWSALGKTSVDGLRETFLQRQGHLYFQDDAWQLKIPQKTFDMLLDRLPWSFALTKMPWMTQPLHVTWR